MSETATQQSDRYCGALLCRHWWTVTSSLYRTRPATSSQCKSAYRDCISPRSYLRVPLTRRAAAFSARCSLSVTDLGVGKYDVGVVHSGRDESISSVFVDSLSSDCRTCRRWPSRKKYMLLCRC